jgi:ankyrin repeat protein
MLLPFLALSAILIIVAIIVTTTDPDRPLFQAIYNNDPHELLTLLIAANGEPYQHQYQTPATTPTTNPNLVTFYLSDPTRIPSAEKTRLCGLIDQAGNGLFHWAAKSLSTKSAQFLYQIGCDYTRGNKQGSTPFMWAATDQGLRPNGYLEYENEEILRNQQFDIEMAAQESQKNPSKDNDGGDSGDGELGGLPMAMRENGQNGQNLAGDDDQLNSYTHVPFNPMLQLLASFARQRDIDEYRAKLEKQYGNLTNNDQQLTTATSPTPPQALLKRSTRQTSTSQSPNPNRIDEMVAEYRPEAVRGSWYNRLIHHANNDKATALHFATEFLSPHSVKTIISLVQPPPLPNEQAPLVAAVTVDGNSAIHLLPPDCLTNPHCKKILTYYILLGFNPTAENKFKRSLQHHIQYDTMTPLLEVQDEWIIARYRGRTQLDPKLQHQYNLKYGMADGLGTGIVGKEGRERIGEEKIQGGGIGEDAINMEKNTPITPHNNDLDQNHDVLLNEEVKAYNDDGPMVGTDKQTILSKLDNAMHGKPSFSPPQAPTPSQPAKGLRRRRGDEL